jgi:hypothetical protein
MAGGLATATRAAWRHGHVVLWFAAGLVALDVAVAARARRWEAYDPHPYRERLRGARRQQWDLVLVGGSPAQFALDPAVLAGTPWRGRPLAAVYNLALPLGTTSEVCLAVEGGLVAPPRLLVYGVTATDLNDSRREASGPRQMMSARTAVRWAAARPGDAAWCARHFVSERLARLWHLHYYRNGIRLWAADFADRHWPGLCPGAAAEARDALAVSAVLRHGDGFTPHPPDTADRRLDLRKAAGRVDDRFPFLERYHVGGGHLAALHRLLDWAERRRVPVLLLDLPVPADLEERLFPQAFAAYRAALARVARERGVPVLRATRAEVGLTDADFGDLVHLNGRGSARLSAWVRQAVAARGAGGAEP